LSKQRDGILRRSLASGTAPKVMHTQSAAEYWTRSGSLVHTDPLGLRDSKVLANVRIYWFGGTQHGPAGFPPTRGEGQNLANPGDYKPFLRALLLSLDRWAETGDVPPASMYPQIKKGTLVDWHQESTGFPAIPDIRYPAVIQQPSFWDYGPRWLSEQIIERQPPEPRGNYRVLVPKCDTDGNELDCLLPPEVKVPIATYTGWNLRNKQAGAEGELVSLRGSYIPFAATKVQRTEKKDSRLSVEERYSSLETYLRKLEEECRRLHRAGYFLEEDIPQTLAEQKKRVAPLFTAIKESQ
jgi:hypothetical protein